jgi:chorismate synthase
MSGANSFGKQWVLTTFGESHGPALGAVIDGCPAGVLWDELLLRKELERRRPGSSAIVSARRESDEPEVLSGVFEGRTLGTPIAVLVRNHDARPQDYGKIAKNPRVGHADDLWFDKFGFSDPRGGGRSSGRETLARVIGGAIAKMFLKELLPDLKIIGFSRKIGGIEVADKELVRFWKLPIAYPADSFVARFPSKLQQKKVDRLLKQAKKEGSSYGGVAEIRALGIPRGLGQPVFHKLKADLASACMSVGASVSFEVGAGILATHSEGSSFHRKKDASIYGGIRGGMATGEPLILRMGFKPTSTVLEHAKRGRHDPCIVPRAIPVLESMVALVLADHLLLARADRVVPLSLA